MHLGIAKGSDEGHPVGLHCLHHHQRMFHGLGDKQMLGVLQVCPLLQVWKGCLS